MATPQSSPTSLFSVTLALLMCAPQPGEEATKDPKLQSIREMHRLANTTMIDASLIQDNLPLAQFVKALQRQQPKDKRFSVTIDEKAFGAKKAGVLSASVPFKAPLKRMTFQTALKYGLVNVSDDLTFRYEPSGIVITTPEAPKPFYTDAYEIGDLVGSPEIERRFGAARQDNLYSGKGLTGKAVQVVQAIVTEVDSDSWREGANPGTIDIVNGARLIVRATAERHLMLDEFLHTLRGIADVAVSAQARLYEVDEAFYNKLKNAKRIPLDELEKQFIEGRFPKDELHSLLAKQKPALVGDEIKVNHADNVTMLSRLRAVVYRAGLAKVNTDNKDLRLVFEGVAFLGRFRVSDDRRSVQLRLTEKAAAVQEVRKVKTFAGNAGMEVLTEIPIPILSESAHQQVLEIPGGGSVLIPVHYRPLSLAAKNRRWVLSITPRIRIEAEEQQLAGSTKKE